MAGRTYRPVSERAKALFGKDDFDAEYAAAEEHDYLSGGHLEIVPSTYKVLSNNFAAGEQGDTVELALPVETEAALIQGGHIERVDKKSASTKKKG
jgi:hypothetical protein